MGNEIPGAHERIVEKIKDKIDISGAKALDLFAREGNWHSKEYATQVAVYEAWEIDSQFEEALKKNLPDANVKITDTFSEVKTTSDKFDLILCDNGQSVYGMNNEFCEHFELFPSIFRIMKDRCTLIINTNLEPYGFVVDSEWDKRRKQFYAVEDSSKFSSEFIAQFYIHKCKENGFEVQWHFFEPLNGFVHMLVLHLKKV